MELTTKTKLFIIDQNALIRFAIGQLINNESDMAVVGNASPTSNLLNEIELVKADMLLVDIPVPREEGIKLLKKLSKLRLPTIVFTKSDDDIARDLIPLLEAGAVGFVLKPSKDQSIQDVKEQLLHEIRFNTRKPKLEQKVNPVRFLDPLKLIMIGSSTGGPEALQVVIQQIPKNCPHGIVLVQHMPADFTSKFAQRLDKLCAISVKEAEEGEILKTGVALLAPGDFHLTFSEIEDGNRRLAKVKLTKEPKVWGLRPTVDKMMTTLAPIYKLNSVGIILTGMGEDGVIGMREIKQQGGKTLVQNKATSVVFGMGQQVIKNNLADEVLPLDKLMSRALELLK